MLESRESTAFRDSITNHLARIAPRPRLHPRVRPYFLKWTFLTGVLAGPDAPGGPTLAFVANIVELFAMLSTQKRLLSEIPGK